MGCAAPHQGAPLAETARPECAHQIGVLGSVTSATHEDLHVAGKICDFNRPSRDNVCCEGWEGFRNAYVFSIDNVRIALSCKSAEQTCLASEDLGHEWQQFGHAAAPSKRSIKLFGGRVNRGQVMINGRIANNALSGLGEELRYAFHVAISTWPRSRLNGLARNETRAH